MADVIQFDAVETAVLLRELRRVLDTHIPGDIVELGCYNGVTSCAMAKILFERNERRTLHLYDSFAGLPEKSAEDSSPAGQQFKTGELKTTKDVVVRRFKQAGLPLPVIHKGWFKSLQVKDMPGQVSFAFLDGDYYASIRDSLHLVWDRMAPGGIIVIDDYLNEALPGVMRAVQQWQKNHTFSLKSEASLAIIQRQ